MRLRCIECGVLIFVLFEVKFEIDIEIYDLFDVGKGFLFFFKMV